MTETQFPIVWKPDPFRKETRRELVPYSITLEEAFRKISDLPPEFWEHGRIFVNGVEVPRDMWGRVRIRNRIDMDVVVTAHVPFFLHGGGGGEEGQRKNPLATVIMVAVLLATLAIGAYGLPFLGAGFAAGTFGAGLVAAGVNVLGALAVSALSPPPTNNPTAQSKEDSKIGTGDKQPSSLTGNVIPKNGAVSRVVGTHRVFPDILSEALIEVIGDDEYIEGIVGLAGPHHFEDIKFNGIAVANIPNLELDVKTGLPGEAHTELVTRQSYTDQPRINLSRHAVNPTNQDALFDQTIPENSTPVWHTVTTGDSPDEFWVTLSWPQGLFRTSNPSAKEGVPFRIQIQGPTGQVWNLPEIHFTSKSGRPLKKLIRFKWADKPISYSAPPADEGPYVAYSSVPGQIAGTPTGGWAADPYFIGAGGSVFQASTILTHGVRGLQLNADGVDVYLEEATFPKGVYDIKVRMGASYAFGSFNVTTYNYNSSIWDFFEYRLVTSLYSTIRSRENVQDLCTIERVSNIWNTPPIKTHDFAYLAFRVKNLAIDKISATASGLVKLWDGELQSWTEWGESSNPAENYRFALTTLNADPIPDEIIDTPGLVEWRQACIDNGWVVNAVVQDNKLLNVLQFIASCGYARTSQTETWGVVRDRDRSAEPYVQIFNPRNLSSFRWEKAFVDLPDAFRVVYKNEEKEYNDDEIFVYREDVDPPQARLFEEIEYVGITDPALVQERAVFDMRQATRRSMFYYGVADFEALVCTRGDLVAVQHETLHHRVGYGRVKTVNKSGDNVTSIVLDAMVPTPPNFVTSSSDRLVGFLINLGGDHITASPAGTRLWGDDWFDMEEPASIFFEVPWTGVNDFFELEPTGVMVRLSDGTVTVQQITSQVVAAERTNTLVFTTPFPDPKGLLAEGALVHTGAVGKEHIRLVVLDMSFSEDQKVNITFVDEAPELWA